MDTLNFHITYILVISPDPPFASSSRIIFFLQLTGLTIQTPASAVSTVFGDFDSALRCPILLPQLSLSSQ